MAANPAAEVIAAGYDIPDDTVAAFNAVFAEDIAPRLLAARKAIEAGLDTLPSLKCSGCTLLVWSVAAVVVGIGAGALASLTAEAGVVRSLAGLVGCSAEAAPAFIVSPGVHRQPRRCAGRPVPGPRVAPVHGLRQFRPIDRRAALAIPE